MKKKVLKKRTLLLLTTIILTITILIILSSQNQQTSQTQIDENKKALTTNSLKQETKNILQTLTNIHPVDLTLEILNIKNIFQQRNLILFSDTGYGDCTSDSQCDDGEFCIQDLAFQVMLLIVMTTTNAPKILA